MPTIPSSIEVTHTGTRSVLTACRSIAPLKLLNPATQGAYCAVVIASYGGGLVEGDAPILRVRCGKGAALYLGTQALTKVYKNPRGIPSKQTLIGTVESQGLAIAWPDPVVPYAQSIFEQIQRWYLAPNACLFLADGHTAGRVAHGEHFAYARYRSHIAIHAPNRPILIERYHSEPSAVSPTHPGAFGPCDVAFNIFIAGTPGEMKFTSLVETLSQTLAPLLQPPDLLLSFASPKPDLFVIRSLAQNIESLHPLFAALRNAIAHPNILGADPLARKY